MDQSDEKVARLWKLRKTFNKMEREPHRDPRPARWIAAGLAIVFVVVSGATYVMWRQGRLAELWRAPSSRRLPLQQPDLNSAPRVTAVPARNEQERFDLIMRAASVAVEAGEETELLSLVGELRRDGADLAPLVLELKASAGRSEAAVAALLLIDPFALCDSPQVLVRNLDSHIDPARAGALDALTSLETEALPHLPLILSRTRRGNVVDRRHAAWGVAHLISRCGNSISDESASQIAQVLAAAAVDDKDNEVRETVLYGLLLLGPREPKIIPHLVTVLGRRDWDSIPSEVIGYRCARACLLQYGDRAWPALVAGLEGPLPLNGDRTPAQSAMQILLEQGSGPVAVLQAEAERIHSQPDWPSDEKKVVHLQNILTVLGEFGPVSQQAAAVLEQWPRDEELEETMKAALPKMRPTAIGDLIQTLKTPVFKLRPDSPRDILQYHNRARARAVAAVGRMGADGHAALRALSQLLADEDIALRYAAVRAILAIDPDSPIVAAMRPRPPPAQPRLVQQRRRPGKDPYLEWLYLDHSYLARQRSDPRPLADASREEVEKNLGSEDWLKVQESLIELLERDELEASLPRLIEVFSRERSEPAHDPIGRLLAEALARLGPKAQQAIPALLAGLETNAERPAAKALIFVASDAPDYVPALRDAFAREKERTDNEPFRPRETTFVLAYLLWKNDRPDDALATLMEGLDSKQASERNQAAMLLGEIGPAAAPAVRLIVPLLESQWLEARHVAIQALEKIGPGAKQAAPALRALLADRACQSEAAMALHSIAADDPNLAAEIAAGLPESTSDERLRQVRVLADLKANAASALPALRRLADRHDPREAEVEAAVTIWKIEQTPQALVELLRRYRTNGRYPIVGGTNLGEVGPPARVAVPKLWAHIAGWSGTQAILKMDIDPSLREELLLAAMYSGNQQVREEAFNVAVIDAFKGASH